MVRGGHGKVEVVVLGQLQDVAGALAQERRGGFIETEVPVEPARRLAPVDAAQVVHDVAAPDDQHALFAEGREARTEVEVVVERLERIEGQTGAR